MGQRTAGDLMFEAYFAEQGYGDVDHEPDLGVGKRPDYVIERHGQRCVVEVKEFAPGTSPFPNQSYGSMDSKTLLKPIRSQLREAARKFKAIENLGMPLTVMLTNPNGALLDLSIPNIVYAMYGDPAFTSPVSSETGGATEPGRFIADRNGRYRADHQYVSGVGLLGRRERRADYIHDLFAQHDQLSATEGFRLVEEAAQRGEIPDGHYHVVTLVKSVSETAVPVPEQFFDGPDDRVFAPDDEKAAYVQVRGRVYP
jgi:hypothetical protein